MLANLLGEAHLLVGGGLLEQPVGLLFAANRARRIDWLLDQERTGNLDTLSPSDSKALMDPEMGLSALRIRVERELQHA
jgi:hypothetical protein